MLKSDFYFDLPENLIAQTPLERRDESRLLCLPRFPLTPKNDAASEISHRRFSDLPSLLKPGDLLVLNNSRVLPARLIGTRSTGGAVELLLLKQAGGDSVASQGQSSAARRGASANVWECLARPGKKAQRGAKLIFGNGELTATVLSTCEGGNRIVEFNCDGVFLEVLDRLGQMPLPPYIHEKLENPERYQTVYASDPGSAAAPTAGLHFTRELLDSLTSLGVEVVYLTLHVGLGTFRPVKADDISDHVMHSESYSLSEQVSAAVNKTKDSGGRVIAVGTTSCRTLEAAADSSGRVSPISGSTDIFIYPGYTFKCIDGLITNFHLPESTLIMLVSALAGRDRVLEAYKEAIALGYRFFSFGDAMLIV